MGKIKEVLSELRKIIQDRGVTEGAKFLVSRNLEKDIESATKTIGRLKKQKVL